MNYNERIGIAVSHNPTLFPAGEVSSPMVQHDTWCCQLVRGDICDCSPDITVLVKGRQYEIDGLGEMKLQ